MPTPHIRSSSLPPPASLEASPVQVFLSYSHDSLEHQARVLALAQRLRQDGLDCRLDRFVQAPAEGWPQWTAQQVMKARFVLLVCTETYHRLFQGEAAAEQGRGVLWEANLIRNDLYQHGNQSDRYVLVHFAGEAHHIPEPMRHLSRYELEREYEQLYRHLTDQPEVQPAPVGPRRRLPPLPHLPVPESELRPPTDKATPRPEARPPASLTVAPPAAQPGLTKQPSRSFRWSHFPLVVLAFGGLLLGAWYFLTEPQRCGDGRLWPDEEECDDGNADATDGCVQCRKAICGDGHRWVGQEECDGPDLAGATCRSIPGGFDGGHLACTRGCRFDSTKCERYWPRGTGETGGHPADWTISANEIGELKAGGQYDFQSITVKEGGTLRLTGDSAEWTVIGVAGRFTLEGLLDGSGAYGVVPGPDQELTLREPDRYGALTGDPLTPTFAARSGGAGGASKNGGPRGGSGGAEQHGNGGGGGGGNSSGGGGPDTVCGPGQPATEKAGGAGGGGCPILGPNYEPLSGGTGGAGGQTPGAPGFDGTNSDPKTCGDRCSPGAGGGGGGHAGADGRLLLLVSKTGLAGQGRVKLDGQPGGKGGNGGQSRRSHPVSATCAYGGGGGGGGAGGHGGWLVVKQPEGQARPAWTVSNLRGELGREGQGKGCDIPQDPPEYRGTDGKPGSPGSNGQPPKYLPYRF